MNSEWEKGFAAGFNAALQRHETISSMREPSLREQQVFTTGRPKTKRKLSAWNKFVKANSKKPRFKYKSGANKGKLNLKAMAVAFRRSPEGKKSKR